jgi:hypothetical protein
VDGIQISVDGAQISVDGIQIAKRGSIGQNMKPERRKADAYSGKSGGIRLLDIEKKDALAWAI